MFLSSESGRRVLNFCYSWGASIVVIGAMFKIVHLPYANEILCFALIVEALVFVLSAFERPASEYDWEMVFPVLKSKNPLDRPDFNGGTVIAGSDGDNVSIGGAAIIGSFDGRPQAPPSHQESVNLGLKTMGLNVSEEDAKNLANSIQKLGEAAEQISKMADLTDATQSYIEQMSTVSQNLERFSTVTGSLSEVSDSIVNSCKMISGLDSDDSEEKVVGYVQQMEQLNQHLSGLNQFYEVHLSGLRSQMETIHHINAGLNRIREMYDNSIVDSTAFRAENERMAQLLAQLNQVYTRLLQAMTINMPAGGGMPYGAPPSYPAYPQQPPYGQMR